MGLASRKEDDRETAKRQPPFLRTSYQDVKHFREAEGEDRQVAKRHIDTG
jgi:hypothetical protein